MKTVLDLRNEIAANLRRIADELDRMPDNAGVRSVYVRSFGETDVHLAWETFAEQFAGCEAQLSFTGVGEHVELKRDGLKFSACRDIEGRREGRIVMPAAHAACEEPANV